MPAHVSSETPLPRLDRSTNYRHPLLLLPLLAFFTSSHQGVDVENSCTKQMFLHLMLHTHPQLTTPAVLINQTSDITNGRT